MRNSIYIIAIFLILFSCSKDSTEPEMGLSEKLEQLLQTSPKAILVDNQYSTRARSNSDGEFQNDEEIVTQISFEILDYSIISEIEQIFIDQGLDFDFDSFQSFLGQKSENGRIASCTEIWTFRAYSNGVESMSVCTDCSGDWECMSTYWVAQ